MSKLSKSLEELLSFNNLTIQAFADNVGIAASSISNYLHDVRQPTIENIVKIANFFNCSVDFLLGKEDEKTGLKFKPCPPFSEQLDFLLKYFNRKPHDIFNNTAISKSSFFDWKRGKRQPTLENVINLAELFDCRVDFILGRES